MGAMHTQAHRLEASGPKREDKRYRPEMVVSTQASYVLVTWARPCPGGPPVCGPSKYFNQHSWVVQVASTAFSPLQA